MRMYYYIRLRMRVLVPWHWVTSASISRILILLSEDADSEVLLRHVWQLVKEKGYKLGNLDCTVIAQAPKMAPYIDQFVKMCGCLMQNRVRSM